MHPASCRTLTLDLHPSLRGTGRLTSIFSRGAKRRGNPVDVAQCRRDCSAPLAVTASRGVASLRFPIARVGHPAPGHPPDRQRIASRPVSPGDKPSAHDVFQPPEDRASSSALCLLGAAPLHPEPVRRRRPPGCPGAPCISGLDLRGGSYLLLEVDMKAVIKERLDSLVDGVRQAAARRRRSSIRRWTPQPDQNRILLQLRDPTQAGRRAGGAAAADRCRGTDRRRRTSTSPSSPDGTITLTLSPVALNARATRRGAAVDRDRPPPHRRDRRGRSADHPAGRRPHRGAVAGHRATPTGSRSCWARPRT